MLQLPRTVVNQILSHAQHAEESEVCGLIASHQAVADRVYPIANVAGDSGRLFTMDPKQQIDAMREMRESGGKLFAIYHSHPHAPAMPSTEDLAQAAYPDALYLIVSLDTKGVLEMKGFTLREGVVHEVDLEVV